MQNPILETNHAKVLIEKLKTHHPSNGNMTELLESMEDVKIFLAWIEPTTPPELFNAMKFVLGMAEQEGIAEEVEGIGLIDRTIAPIIRKLNEQGYATIASCSGLSKDHPNQKETMKGYLSFESDKQRDVIIEAVAERLGIPIEKGKTYFQPSITLRFLGQSDEEIERKWRSFDKELEK